ncbi:hypothetical protein Bca4012_010619 [Brassica carinata]
MVMAIVKAILRFFFWIFFEDLRAVILQFDLEEAEEDGDNQEVEALVEPAASVAAAPMNQEMEVRKEYERRIGEARIKRRNDFVDALLEVSSEFSALRKLQDDYGHDHGFLVVFLSFSFASPSVVARAAPSCSLLVSVVSGVASVCCASGRVLCLSAFSVVLSPCSLVVAACGASSVAEASVRLSVFPGGSALVLELLRYVKFSLLLRSLLCTPQIEWCYGSSGILGALVGQRVSEFGYGFVSSGGLSVYRSVFSIWVAVRWVYTVTVECNGGGNLRCNPLNDGIVGLRLLLVPPGASFISPVWVCARILRLGVLCVAVGSCRNCSIQGLRAPFSR